MISGFLAAPWFPSDFLSRFQKVALPNNLFHQLIGIGLGELKKVTISGRGRSFATVIYVVVNSFRKARGDQTVY